MLAALLVGLAAAAPDCVAAGPPDMGGVIRQPTTTVGCELPRSE